jgi:hypothetical protein
MNDKLVSPIKVEEIEKAIYLWYKSMKEHLLPLLVTYFNYVLKEGSLPPSWNEAISHP